MTGAPLSTEVTAPAPIERWVNAILLAARRIGVTVSPELVRNASVWAGSDEADQAIIDIALSAGLSARFVELPVRHIATEMLPALIPFGEKIVGVISGISEDRISLTFTVDGVVVERSVPMAQLEQAGRQRILLVQEREVVRDDRLDAYLRERPKSWLRGIFTNNWGTFVQLGLGSLVGNLLAIGTSLFAMQVWDRVVPARSINTLWVLASGVALALVLELLIRTARVSIADHFGKNADLKLSAMFFARVMDIRNDARPRSPGSLIAQLRDLEQIRELLTSSSMGVLIDLPFVVAFLFIIWVLGGPLVLVPLAAIPLLIVPGILAQIPFARFAREGLSEAALRNAILMESIYRVGSLCPVSF